MAGICFEAQPLSDLMSTSDRFLGRGGRLLRLVTTLAGHEALAAVLALLPLRLGDNQ